MASQARHMTHVPAVRVEVEKSLGITQRSAPVNFAWTGDIRKRYVPFGTQPSPDSPLSSLASLTFLRYTDFLVYEIAKDGKVIHLYDYPEDGPATTTLPKPQRQAPQVCLFGSNSSPRSSGTARTHTNL